MVRHPTEVGFRLSGPLLNMVAMVAGALVAYFLTIQSLRIDLATKAETGVVGTLDKKLGNIEVILKEGVVSKEQFFIFSKEMEARLTRIEAYLAEGSGGKIGQ
ncbi:MAG: hypothetical protein KOO62_08505 [candidate division Zixibacteria bacterium]|nr:hypothetical protein [candidate division Zixibacteria bacterium]